jgi:hypothetical protein
MSFWACTDQRLLGRLMSGLWDEPKPPTIFAMYNLLSNYLYVFAKLALVKQLVMFATTFYAYF